QSWSNGQVFRGLSLNPSRRYRVKRQGRGFPVLEEDDDDAGVGAHGEASAERSAGLADVEGAVRHGCAREPVGVCVDRRRDRIAAGVSGEADVETTAGLECLPDLDRAARAGVAVVEQA